jgi:hypothetical protein
MADRTIEPHPSPSLAGPAALALAVCAAAAGLVELGAIRVGPFADTVAPIAWYAASGLWLVTAVVALTRREGLWVFASAPLVLGPLILFGLLEIYCWKSCEL